MYRVLLVDDEQIERMALAKKIDRYYGDKVDIYHAVNGREAVAMCGEQKNDIVIMDISMPEMNGVMAAKYIRKMDDECSIIFLSAYDDFEYARNAIKVRALDYLLKPCDMNDLLAVMDTALQKLDKENAFNGNSISGKEQNKETEICGSNANNVRENRPKRTDNVRNSDEKTTIKYLKEYVENNYIYDISMQEAAEEMVDMEVVKEKAIRLAEERGIIFIDEIDKIAGRNNTSGADVSREGVQRDILPIVEGATVKTKYGQMKTDHILFIAAGAFHVSKPSDLIPELQGRFPVRVELSSLTKEDLRKILTEPRQALIRQYESLLETEGVTITFTESSLDAIAEIATHVNEETEDIGARRLYTILERVLEDISFEAPDLEDKNVTIDGDYIREKMGRITQDIDVSNYIL